MANKKAKRQRRRAAGVDPNEQRRQRLEARRQAKAEALAARRRTERRERIVRAVIFVGVIAAVIWFLFFRGGFPSEIEGSERTYQIEQLSSAGLQEHQEPPIQYADLPPVSGPHASNTAPCGTHGAPVPDWFFVHSMEHGAVGILFDPTLELDTVRRIEGIVGEFEDGVLSAPYQGLEDPIVVTSWSRRLHLETFDEQAIREYIDAFRGKGPEAGAPPCTAEADEQFQPAQPSPSPEPGASPEPGPEPSPSPEPSPEPSPAPS